MTNDAPIHDRNKAAVAPLYIPDAERVQQAFFDIFRLDADALRSKRGGMNYLTTGAETESVA